MKRSKHRILPLVLAALLLPVTPVLAAEDAAPAAVDTGVMTLAFAEEFDGGALNTELWSYDTGTGFQGWGNWELQYYTDRPDNVQVGGGTLKITAKSEQMGGSRFTSGRIKTQGKAVFGEGYVEARIRVPSETGVWPAFWMMGEEGGWPLCGEIDILETKNKENRVESTVHWADETSPAYADPLTWYLTQRYDSHGESVADKTAWHTYGVYKTKTQLAFYIDGKRHFVKDITNSLQSELHQDFYVLLNVACGGNYTGNTTPPDGLNAQMEVDYLRYYTRTGEAAAPRYTDVPVTAPWAKAVAWCAERGIIQGYDDGRFDPNGTLDRRTLAVMLYRAAGEPPVSGKSDFTDVPPEQWYADAVVWARDTGLMLGYGGGRFGAFDPLTVPQMDVVIGRSLGRQPERPGDSASQKATRVQVAMALYALSGEKR